ncbi:conserved exported protein of unknown function [Sterolibacterium denitrificans]|uniref:Uncharacterized protein n=2 Tax=Sterolibacterium denitrificans TaxID=157592 RepID=A0A656Z800_9PROT|nr:tetratricopeptide repeat protein [Sterolibacterium denitrificans]KYC28971.1 hypothetical protein ACY05_03765 [Sterolibacterium denitrificans]SMB23044.1 conserved exported protein of unknown function [Sterolibacterium denitrificans]
MNSRASSPIVSLLLASLLALSLTAGNAHAQETLRPEISKPLVAAQDLIKAKKYREALAKIRDADAVAGKTPHETLTIERMRLAAANEAGDADSAAKAVNALLASGKLSASEKHNFIQAVAVAYYRNKNYAQAIDWAQRYFKEGGRDGQMRTLQVQSYYLNGDYANAARQLSADIAAEEKAGGRPGVDSLQMLASCYLQLNDMTGYVTALEKLVTWHPKPEYWADLLHRLQRKSGFADRLALDLARLKFVSDNLGGTGDYMEMAQLALQAGYPAEARKIVDAGYAKNLLGTGPAAEVNRHKRLRDLVNKQLAEDQKNLAQGERQANAAKDGTGLVNIGYNLVLNGQFDKGLGMMEQGLAKGGLKRPEDAKLHLGHAYLLAGQKDKAVQTLQTVQGTDGTADLARLWILQAQR